jgi:hypothetical protein
MRPAFLEEIINTFYTFFSIYKNAEISSLKNYIFGKN